MPLVFAVLIIIVIAVVSHDNSKDSRRQAANNQKFSRNTNAAYERELLDGFLKQGYTFNEAYPKMIEALVEHGYEPCIPKDKYIKGEHFETSMVRNPGGSDYSEGVGGYDSELVKMKRRRLTGQQGHGGIENLNDVSYFARLSERNPDAARRIEYDIELKRSILFHETRFKIGDMLIYPNYGTCEVIDIEYNYNKTKGWYIVKPLKKSSPLFGDTASIKIGDKSIRKVSERAWD